MGNGGRPGPLDALERFMESALESTVQRLLGAKLQPIQLAKAAARQMERHQLVGPAGVEVPNAFEIQLHPSDFAFFDRWKSSLERELASYLERYANQRGWRQPGPTRVNVGAVPGTRRSRPRVEATFADTGAPDEIHSPQPPAEATRSFAVGPMRTDATGESAEQADGFAAWLVNDDGERFPLEAEVTTLGRALDNQVVLPDPRVSRFHAEIRRHGDRFVLRDLGSSNGTTIGGSRTERAELRSGDLVSLGGYRLTFETGGRTWGSA